MADNIITIEVQDQAVLRVLQQMATSMTPAGMQGTMSLVGEKLAKSTMRCFVSGTAPDGNPRGRGANPRPLIDTTKLSTTIRHDPRWSRAQHHNPRPTVSGSERRRHGDCFTDSARRAHPADCLTFFIARAASFLQIHPVSSHLIPDLSC
jgi:hypothetical protein